MSLNLNRDILRSLHLIYIPACHNRKEHQTHADISVAQPISHVIIIPPHLAGEASPNHIHDLIHDVMSAHNVSLRYKINIGTPKCQLENIYI